MVVEHGRERFTKQALGGSLQSNIKQSKVLMVGAGGIGCELLKNLVLTGFGEIHVVDLDTIDLSNLNRQFLFGHEHIKKSKALVAKETASAFNPKVKIEAHHGNIKDSEFNIEWFRGFALIFNALDNLEARRHVNKMCLLAERPLIESGTTGFNGQVQVIKKSQTECYDCTPKEVPKSFPVCTIRSTPSQPIHCIVWAKSYLFAEVFGTSEFDEDKFDHSSDADNAEEIKKLEEEAQALKKIRNSVGTSDFPRLIFEKVFTQDIERLRSMEDMWKSRKAPAPLSFEDLSLAAKEMDGSVAQNGQKTWSIAENFAVFVDSTQRLSDTLAKIRATTTGVDAALSFDKDDEDNLDFVASSANLRSSIFDIAMKSKFDIKQMAGNIIPAIATTNAMTAGLCVLQAFKVLRNQMEKSKMVFLVQSTDRVFNTESLRKPNPECAVCSKVSVRVEVDRNKATLGNLVDDILRTKLGYGEELAVQHGDNLLYDPDFDESLSKTFVDLNIEADDLLTIVDQEDDNPRVDLALSIVQTTFAGDNSPYHLPETPQIGHKPRPAEVEPSASIAEPTRTKRLRDEDEAFPIKKRAHANGEYEELQPTKKAKTDGDAVAPSNGHANSKEDLVVVENGVDGADGAIIID